MECISREAALELLKKYNKDSPSACFDRRSCNEMVCKGTGIW